MLSTRGAVLALSGLAFFMTATRFPGLASNLHLQDASWAIFFLAGFYLRDHWRWAFPALMATAVAIDLIAINYYDVSNYCLTVAYWFLVPSYVSLWIGGSWLRSHATFDVRGLLILAASAFVAASVCFLISNGSFYWLGGRAASVTLQGWIANFTAWYWPFVKGTLAYLAAAALVHAPVVKIAASLRARASHRA